MVRIIPLFGFGVFRRVKQRVTKGDVVFTFRLLGFRFLLLLNFTISGAIRKESRDRLAYLLFALLGPLSFDLLKLPQQLSRLIFLIAGKIQIR